MKICVDLDGTIAQNKKTGQEYQNVLPMDGASETLHNLKQKGFYIIIHTARNMGTHNNNLGKVIAAQASLVTQWLEKYGIPYDELIFGKPNVDYFIDDKGFSFKNWEHTQDFLLTQQKNKNV